MHGPTEALMSASTVRSELSCNGALLNMILPPQLFQTDNDICSFVGFLRKFVDLQVFHAQFSVVSREDLLAAQKNPELYRALIVRVEGYSSYFTELSPELQQEIIDRTSPADDITAPPIPSSEPQSPA
jgi:formate C-acetyltransferase